MSIISWPLNERPREKLLTKGAASLSDAELLAIFLRTGIKGKNAIELSRELIANSGGLRQLLNQSQQQICQNKGLGTAKYVQIQAALEMARRYLEQTIQRGDALESPEQTRQYLKALLRDSPNEQFGCLFMDNRHRVIQYETLFHGSISSASVHPRVVVQRALFHNAAAIILAHNHPSGVSEPSRADIDITRTLKQALQLVEVRVLDHLIVGDFDITSLAEQGYI
ncbi:RadC family protein [Pleionea mediterranea]|uniref:DNA replication and repair protein RadC n=1 Tax=Pleionea mediterranea TaxID=523701 RepID=A0A316FLD0_9GAMM|nr:DNA repair protein RadC [Pleionea mediterranea]PWK48526.1 DNA replication and repair protein RadC [Pleionea mediterranea]